MRIYLVIIFLALFFIKSISPVFATGITSVTFPPSINRFSKFEISFNLTSNYDNPFDPLEVSVSAEFTSPIGSKKVAYGFWDNNPQWKIRFTPDEVGTYTFVISGNDKYGVITKSNLYTFSVLSSSKPGFVKVAPNQKYFQFSQSNQTYFPIGHNQYSPTSGPDRGSIRFYQTEIPKLKSHSGNWLRVWLTKTWNTTGIEWSIQDGYPGLGRYHLGNAANMDTIFQLAQENNIYIDLVFTSFHDFTEKWSTNPYHTIVSNPEDFLSNAQARNYFKRYIRYIVSRWGYSPNLFSYELMNEITAFPGFSNGSATWQNMIDWHRDMSSYMKSLDANHLVSTSEGMRAAQNPSLWANADIWSLNTIDWVSLHIYSLTNGVLDPRLSWFDRFGKPKLVGEYGVDERASLDKTDSQGIAMHNSLWGGLAGGYAGTAMNWWAEQLFWGYNWYAHYDNIAKFVEGENLSSYQVDPISLTTSSGIEAFGIKSGNSHLIFIHDLI